MIRIVIPCFNEAARLNVDEYISFLGSSSEIELLFVDDGSTDRTDEQLGAIVRGSNARASFLRLPQNRGKAEAVRQGILSTLQEKRGISHLGYWDADLATPLALIQQFTQLAAANPRIKLICGSRIPRLGSNIRRYWYRHYPGRLIATLISLVLGLPVYDTQCGAKLIERELAAQIFCQPFISAWLFDVELIARVIGLVGKEEANEMVCELPLSSWQDTGESSIRLTYLPKIPLELMRIYAHYRKQLRR